MANDKYLIAWGSMAHEMQAFFTGGKPEQLTSYWNAFVEGMKENGKHKLWPPLLDDLMCKKGQQPITLKKVESSEDWRDEDNKFKGLLLPQEGETRQDYVLRLWPVYCAERYGIKSQETSDGMHIWDERMVYYWHKETNFEVVKKYFNLLAALALIGLAGTLIVVFTGEMLLIGLIAIPHILLACGSLKGDFKQSLIDNPKWRKAIQFFAVVDSLVLIAAGIIACLARGIALKVVQS